MKFLHLVWRNLTRKMVRTVFTLLSICVAFLLFGVLIAVQTGFGSGIELAGMDRLIMIHKVSIIQPLPYSYYGRIQADEGVDSVAHANWFGGIYQEPKNFFAQIAVVPEEWLEIYPEIELPDEQREAWLANRIGAMVGIKTAERFGWKIGDRIPIQGTIFRPRDGGTTWEFVIEAIYTSSSKEYDTSQFFFHYDYLTENSGLDGFVGWYVLDLADGADAVAVAERLDARFANSPAETKTTTEKAFIQAFANQAGNLAAIVRGILGVVFFTLLLVSGNTMAQAVRERTKELAVLKTLGFRDGLVMGLVLAESLALAVIGGGFGLAMIFLGANVPGFGAAMATAAFRYWSVALPAAVLLLVVTLVMRVAGRPAPRTAWRVLGGVFGLGVLLLVGTIGKAMEGLSAAALPTTHIPTRYLALGITLVFAIGLASGLVPSVQALRLRIVDALRRS